MRRLPSSCCISTTSVALAAIVSIPLVFLFVTHGDWLLDAGGEDNWVYVKYFHVWANPHRELREAMDQHYKATRVPWIVPGYLAYRLFGPLAGTYVLHLAVLIGAALAFWAGARRLFGDGVAAVSTILLMAAPAFHSGGIMRFWNYHAQINLAYYLLAMLGLVMGATSSSTRRAVAWYVSAGAAIAACMWTGLTYVVMLPAFGVFALTVPGRFDPRGLLVMLLGGLVGALLSTALFGLASVLAGGPFLFFWRQIIYSFEWAGSLPSPAPFSIWFPAWFKQASWLGLPPLVALASLVALVPLLRSPESRGRRWLVVGCWLSLWSAWASLIGVEVKEQALIEIAYQFQMILGPTVYALAALLWFGLRLSRQPVSQLGMACLVPALLLPQVLLDAELRRRLRLALDPAQLLPILPSEYWIAAVLLGLGGVLLVLAIRSTRLPAVAAAGLVVGLGLALTAVDADAYLPPTPCSSVASQYRVIQRMIVWTTDEQVDTRAMVWYDPGERRQRPDGCPSIELFPIYDAIAHGTTIREAAMPMPERIADLKPDLVGMALRNRLTLTLLTTPETAETAERELRAWIARAPTPATIRPRQRFEVADGEVAVVLQAFDVRRP